MKRAALTILLAIFSMTLYAQSRPAGHIRINYVGYLPKSVKVAVYILEDENAKYDQQVSASGQTAWVKRPSAVDLRKSDDGKCHFEGGVSQEEFFVCDAVTDKVVFTGKARKADPEKWALKEAYRLNFSDLQTPGGYYILFRGVKSPNVKIGADVYDGAADILLYYMRQQQCGYNPFVDTLCHQKDGYIVDHPTRSGEWIDVRGGWHDASDFLQYQTTSATATYHMLFAYNKTDDKSLFKDKFDADGRPGSNGIPDILDQAKWGLDWLVKMNPGDKEMYNQIADDRDHIGFKPPQFDVADYGWGPGNGRPVYYLTG